MAQYTGEIAFLDAKSLKSKKTGKPFTAYKLKLRLESGELGPQLEAGFTKPEFDKGDYVAVTTEQKGEYENITSIAAAERPAAKAAVPARSGSEDSADQGADRQTQIVLQHSQEMAVREVALLLANGALPLSKADNKAGTTKRYEEIVKAVEKLTVQRYFDVVSGRLLDTVADAGEVNLEADGDLPAAGNSTATSEDDE